MRFRKKAVSPVIAVVLIIALVAAAVGTVWVLFQNFSSNTVSASVDLDVVGFYDFDGNGRAEMAIIKLTPKLNTITVDVSGATFSIENTSFVSSSWTKLGNSATLIAPFDTGEFYLYTTDPSEELIPNTEYTVKINIVTEVSLTFTISSVTSVNPLTFELFSEAGSLSLDEEVLRDLSPKDIELLASRTILSAVRVVLYDADTGFPVTKMDKLTDSNGKVSFKVGPGRYYAKVILGSHSFINGPFFHPSSPDSINTIREFSVKNVFSPVTVHYSEQNNPVGGATISVREKVVVSGNVYEKVTATDKITDVNGTVSYVLRNGEYKFLAYSGSTIPAPSNWVDVAVQSDVNINVEPGVVYVKILSSSGTPIQNARVSAYGVIGSKNTYLTYGYTNATGYVRFSITSSNFLIKVTQGAVYTSNIFKVIGGQVYEYIIAGNDLTVNVGNQALDAVPNTYVYLYNEYGQYYASGISDSNGQVNFNGLSNGSYYLKYYSGTTYHQTDKFPVTGATVYNITISGFPVYANISTNGSPRVNQYVYAYAKSTGAYLGYGRTNSSGIATFFFESNASTYFRTSAYIVGIGYSSFTSSVFTPSSGLLVNFKLGGIQITVTVKDQNSQVLSSQYVSAYDSNNFTVQTGYTNTNGQVKFVLNDGELFTMGIGNLRSIAFNTSLTTSVALTVYVVPFSVNAKALDGSNLANAYVYLYENISNSWRYAGYQRTNSSGLVDFTKSNSSIYRVYIYSGGIRMYSNAFTISQGAVIVVQPATMKVEINLPSGAYANSYVYLYTLQNTYVSYARTDSVGNATFSIVNGTTYKVYIPSSVYYSDPFLGTDGGFKRITINLPSVQLQVKTGSGVNYKPSSSYEYVYVYYANGSYAGYSYLNSSGAAVYLLANNTEYYFRFYKGGREILSSSFNATNNLIVDLTINGYLLDITVNFDGSPVSAATVYLYDATTRRYMGYGTTNSSGIVKYDGILNGSYYIYVYSSGIRQLSSDFTVGGDTSYTYNVVTTTLSVTVYQVDSSSKVGSGQRVYLRTIDGYYSGFQSTNTSGMVSFTVADNSTYYAYSYYTGVRSYIYSDLIAINGTSLTSIKPVSMFIDVVNSASAPVNNFRVYLMKEGLSLGYGTSDVSGTATVYANNGTQYFLVASKYSPSYGYSYTNFTKITASQGATGVINIGGGDVHITVTDSTGTPASNVYVYLYIKSGTSYQWTGYYGKTDSNGQLTLSVGEGDYIAYVYGVYSPVFTVNSASTNVTLIL